MNILAWLLYLKTLVFLVQPIGSMGMRLCGRQIPQMMAIVCEGRGYYYTEGSTDSPLLTESQAKTFTKSSRKRTGKIVTECCHNPCEIELIETYCAPLKEGQIKFSRRNLVNTIVEEPQVRVPQPVEENEFVEEPNPYVSQDIAVETTSDELGFWDSESEPHNVLNGADMMFADQVRGDTSENDEEHIPKDKSFGKQMNITESQTDEILDNEDTDSENSESKLSISTTKGNSRTKPTHRPTSRNSRRKNSREKKKNKSRTRSREKKGRKRSKPKKNKNKHDRRRKGKRNGGDRDDITQPTDEFITEIEVPHSKLQAVSGMPSSRSEPANLDDPTDPGTRSDRSFVTTIHARLINNNRRRR